MTDTDTTEVPLDEAQQARAAALAYARQVLADNSAAFVSRGDSLPKRFGTQDLIDVAQWILDGTDPLESYRDEGAARTATVLVVPDDQVERIGSLNSPANFPNGLLLVPESARNDPGDNDRTVELPVPPVPATFEESR